jgi:hypothetical protein
MKKIPCLFVRIFEPKKRPVLTPDVSPGCEWVLAGEGRATRKLDGTATMIRSGKLYRRLEVRKGKPQPADWEPCEPEPDPTTGSWPGWLLVGDEPESKYHREAFDRLTNKADGTYELVGPKINGNPDEFTENTLVLHGTFELPLSPRTFEELREYLGANRIEGIVWHHEDRRMVKLRRDDFGQKWPVPKT